MKWTTTIAALVVAVAALAGTATAATRGGGGHDGDGTGFTVVASGLLNPRGFDFGRSGDIYVAEGGSGGGTSTDGLCTQIPGPSNGSPTGPGPNKGGPTARISRIDRHGTRTTVADGLPSSVTAIGASVLGVGAVAFLDGRLYAVTAGGGCSHGNAGTVNSLLRVHRGGRTTKVADLSAYLAAHPPGDPQFELNDWEPDGTWYGMVAARGALYATESNHQEVDRIDTNGRVTRIVDMSAQSDARGEWIGPTAITYHDGDFYVGTLSPFPIVPGDAAVYKLSPTGHLSLYASGLTTVLGVAWKDDRLYVLESMNDTTIPFPTPNQEGSGKVVRVEHNGSQTVVVSGLSFPSAMAFGPDGKLYISNHGFSSPTGEIVRADVDDGGGRR